MKKKFQTAVISTSRGSFEKRFLKSLLMVTSKFKMNSACRFRSSCGMESGLRSISMRPLLCVSSSKSGESGPPAMDEMPGRVVGRARGDECAELLEVEESRDGDGGNGDLYTLFRGGSLYWMSPVTSEGYKEPGLVSGVVDDAGLRWSARGSLGSTGKGCDGPAEGRDLRGIMGRMDLPMYSGGARWATMGAPREGRR